MYDGVGSYSNKSRFELLEDAYVSVALANVVSDKKKKKKKKKKK
jgi:hypothetical protein